MAGAKQREARVPQQGNDLASMAVAGAQQHAHLRGDGVKAMSRRLRAGSSACPCVRRRGMARKSAAGAGAGVKLFAW